MYTEKHFYLLQITQSIPIAHSKNTKNSELPQQPVQLHCETRAAALNEPVKAKPNLDWVIIELANQERLD